MTEEAATDEAHRLVQDFFAAVNERALERFDTIVHVDYNDHVAGQPRGREAVKAYFGGMIGAFPDLVMTIENIVAEGDLVAVRNLLVGTHLGALGEMPASGKRISVGAFQLYRIEAGQLAEHWEVADLATLFKQIGS
jgi:steroid delta-isomerase-like uncharacterized protein